MVRLIDAEAWKLDILLFHGCNEKTAWIFDRINHAPTVDAVPVIRCKDCKHYYEREWIVGGGSYTTCWYQTIANAQPNDFCSRADRKEE